MKAVGTAVKAIEMRYGDGIVIGVGKLVFPKAYKEALINALSALIDVLLWREQVCRWMLVC